MALATRHSQRVSLQAQAAGHRGAAESTRRGSGGALPETPGQKYRLIYLSAHRGCSSDGLPGRSGVQGPLERVVETGQQEASP